jgi:hypothetical protein
MVRHEAAEALGAIAGADGEGGGATVAVAEEEEEEEQGTGGAGPEQQQLQEKEQGAGGLPPPWSAAPTTTTAAAAAEVEASCRAKLREHLDDACQEVRETCELALARIEHVERERERRRRERQVAAAADATAATPPPPPQPPSFQESPYFSVDPTPALPSTTPLPVLEALLMDPSKPMFERYQALFAIRNRGGADSVRVLCAALRGCSSALLKHEVAYVLGQMQSVESVRALKESLADVSEHAMVRHEAAEALGAVAGGGEQGGGGGGEGEKRTEESAAAAVRAALLAFSRDPEPIVAQSCEVALDVAEHEEERGFEYADLGKDEVVKA